MLVRVRNYKQFRKYYEQYQKELMEIQNEKWYIQTAKELREVPKRCPTFKDNFIVIDGEIVGFVCWQNLETFSYVNQLYVLKEHRNKKIASEVVKEITKGKGKVLGRGLVFEVLDKNENAKKFWESVTKDEFELTKQSEIDDAGSKATRYYYRRKLCYK